MAEEDSGLLEDNRLHVNFKSMPIAARESLVQDIDVKHCQPFHQFISSYEKKSVYQFFESIHSFAINK